MQKLYSKILLVKIITITALQLNIVSAQQDGSVYGFVTDSSSGDCGENKEEKQYSAKPSKPFAQNA